MARHPSLEQLRAYAVARSLFAPTTLPSALRRLRFVQADPIRAPARAQDLTLRHRVRDYRAGDLERRYPKLPIEEDFLVNYGFVTHDIHALLHPREVPQAWTAKRRAQAAAIVEFVAQRGVVHPREVDAHFAHGKVRNWFGGSSNASTQLLDELHYRGQLRIARREGGTRLYALPRGALGTGALANAELANELPAKEMLANEVLANDALTVDPGPASAAERLDRLVDCIIGKYAPLPAPGLSRLLSLLRGGAPQWAGERKAALRRVRERHPTAVIEGIEWVWPAGESPASRRWQIAPRARLLAPFDPVVWDRDRFERFWGWTYRFEAYTPGPKRKLGYYALPLLWADQVVGWGNLSVVGGRLVADIGFVDAAHARDRALARSLDDELADFARFLGCADAAPARRVKTTGSSDRRPPDP